MTLGKKLSNHRKMLGWTQQQLGEYLNLSAQAVSKWENDLAEPDLVTLKTLANLYSVTVDDLLNNDIEDFTQKTAEPQHTDAKANATIGFCKNCGIVVTEDNLGERTPVVLCNNCYEEKQKQALLASLKRKQEAEAAEENRKARLRDLDRAMQAKSNELKGLVKKSSIVAGIFASIVLVLWIVNLADGFSAGKLIASLITSYAVFAFVSLLFYDTAVLDVLEYMGTASINWPGVIFSFDLDGFIFLIAVKALFAVLGFLFGLICAVIGAFVSIFISMFIYPFVMSNMKKCIAKGEGCKYTW